MPMTQQDIKTYYEQEWRTRSEAAVDDNGLGYSNPVEDAVLYPAYEQLVADLKRPDGTLPLLQLAPEWEERFQHHQIEGERGHQDVALPPEDFNKLANSVSDRLAKAGETGVYLQ